MDLRIVHNGHDHPLPSGATVFAGSPDVGLALILCDSATGAQDVQLQAQVTGASVAIGNRSLAMAETVHLP